MKAPLLSVRQAQERLGVSGGTVRLLLKSGRLPGLKVENLWRVEESALEAYIARQKQALLGSTVDVSVGRGFDADDLLPESRFS